MTFLFFKCLISLNRALPTLRRGREGIFPCFENKCNPALVATSNGRFYNVTLDTKRQVAVECQAQDWFAGERQSQAGRRECEDRI